MPNTDRRVCIDPAREGRRLAIAKALEERKKKELDAGKSDKEQKLGNTYLKNQRTTHDDSEERSRLMCAERLTRQYIENERIFQRAGASEWENSVLCIPSNVQNNKVGVDMAW
jgi:hypothetical protein